MMTPENREAFYNDLIHAVKKASQTSPEAELAEFSALLFAVVFQCYEQVFHEDAKSRYLSALAVQMAMVAMTDEQAHAALEAALAVSKDLVAKGLVKPDHPTMEE
jgi:hypothetical protein